MVFITDEGSEFKAPLSKVWALAQSEGVHKHSSQIDPQTSMEGEHPVIAFGTRMPDGNVVRQKVRLTMVPPVGFVIEYTEGPVTGTKLMQYYIPKGNKTGVNVVGEANSSVMPESQLKAAVLKALETAFKEDEENLKRLP